MALQEFVEQSEQRASKFAQDAVPHPVDTQTQMQSRTKVAFKDKTTLSTETRVEASANASAHELVSKAPVSLSGHDREVLASLAAVQIRYDRPAEAVPYLMMLRKTDQNDHQAARLLALALMKLGNWEQAEHVLEDISQSPEGDSEAETGVISFYRSLVAFKQHKMSIARQWLQRFRALVTGGGV